jgi:hypothetical protein
VEEAWKWQNIPSNSILEQLLDKFQPVSATGVPVPVTDVETNYKI